MLSIMNELTKNYPKVPKLKPSYEKYAESILNGKTQRQAGLDAGFPLKRADTQANRMGKNDKVKAYLAYHRQIQALKNNVTREDVVPFLRKIRDDNLKKRPQVSVNACAELAKIGRMYEPATIANVIINQNSLTVVHAPGALEAIEEERKQSQGKSD